MRVLTHTAQGNIKLYLSSFLPIIIIAMATALSFTLGKGNRNLLLIGVMGISPFIVLKFRKFYWSDIPLVLYMFSIVTIPYIFHPESMRWSTVIYSLMFSFTYLAYKQLLYLGNFNVENYKESRYSRSSKCRKKHNF
jgi:hypothetical protein